jgi:hypothetical protein
LGIHKWEPIHHYASWEEKKVNFEVTRDNYILVSRLGTFVVKECEWCWETFGGSENPKHFEPDDKILLDILKDLLFFSAYSKEEVLRGIDLAFENKFISLKVKNKYLKMLEEF